MELLLFDREDDAQPSRVVPLDPAANRTYHYWHAFVPGIRPGQLYGYRAYGPNDPANGLRFDPAKVLLDPYGRGVVVPNGYTPRAARAPGDNAATAMKSVVVDNAAYDWEGDVPFRRPSSRTVVYEMHVRGFTRHPSSGRHRTTRGTYAGLIEKIPYLKELGVTAVELLPVFHVRPAGLPDGPRELLGLSAGLVLRAAPAVQLSPRPARPGGRVPRHGEGLHRAGIEVILDVVYNHTAEGDTRADALLPRHRQPDLLHSREGGSRYANYTGCGNTLNANNPIVRRMIIDSLRYWVRRCTSTDSASTSRRSCPATRPAGRCRIRRSCGTSSPTRCWRGPS